MAGDKHGAEETQEQEAAQEHGNEQAAQGQKEVTVGNGAAGADYEKAIAERDARIAELEGQVADAAKNAETAEALRIEIAELKAQGESDRIDFKLQLAGCRNIKAARAVLDDHGGDIDKLKEAEPWLFAKHLAGEGASGTTGLPNAGAASDEGKTLKHWREIAGLSDDNEKKEQNMPNSIAFAKNYVSVIDEVYQRTGVSGVLNSGRRMVRAGHNAKEIMIPKISVTGLGDYTRNVGYKTGSITYELSSSAARCPRRVTDC